MYDVIKVLAQIEYKKSNTGRQSPLKSGYRPLFSFPNAGTNLSGQIDLINKDSFAQGEVGEVYITFIKGIIDISNFKVGEQFIYSEGISPLGEGKIIRVLNL